MEAVKLKRSPLSLRRQCELLCVPRSSLYYAPIPEKPENLISKKVMVDVLYDMALISSAKGSDRRILEKKGIVPQDYIYSKFLKVDDNSSFQLTFLSYRLIQLHRVIVHN